MADWVAIRTEYLTTQISTRDLAQKHGVSYSTLRKRAEKEEWAQKRAEHERKTVALVAQKTMDAVSDQQADRLTQLITGGQRSAELLLDRLDQMASSGKIKTYEVKAITEALKNIRDLYKSDSGSDGDKYQKIRDLLGGVPDALE